MRLLSDDLSDEDWCRNREVHHSCLDVIVIVSKHIFRIADLRVNVNVEQTAKCTFKDMREMYRTHFLFLHYFRWPPACPSASLQPILDQKFFKRKLVKSFVAVKFRNI